MRKYLIKAFLIAVLVEGVTLPPLVMSMGHAGPQGPLAALGWLGLLVNFPGFWLAMLLGPYDSTFNFGVAVFGIQILIFMLIAVSVKLILLNRATKVPGS